MRIVLAIALTLLMSARPSAQDAPSAPREGLVVGVMATPALEGGGPWFMPAVRVSAPLGPRMGVDFDVGRIFGGTDIRSFQAVQLRLLPARRRGPESSYWIVGLMRLNATRSRYTSGTLGRGWSHTYRTGLRLTNEVGFSGGDGYLCFVTAGVQWGTPKTR